MTLVQKFKTLRNDQYHHKAKIVLSLGIYSNILHTSKSKKKNHTVEDGSQVLSPCNRHATL